MLTKCQRRIILLLDPGGYIMPMTPKEMVRLLKANGFIEVRQPGTSHLRLKNEKTGKSTTVPMHSKELGKGLEQEILKQAGLK